MIGIYKLTSPLGEVYIGQGENVKRRMRRYHTKAIESHPRLCASAIKHGIENFTFEIIHHCQSSELNYWERYYQDFFDVCGPKGLNSKLTPTEEKKGVYMDEAKARMSERSAKYNLGVVLSCKTRSRVAKSKLGNQNMLGVRHSPEAIEKCKLGNVFKFKQVKCIETGIIYESISDCSRKLGVHTSAVTQSIKLKGRCKGNHFEFVGGDELIGKDSFKIVFDTQTGVFYDSIVDASNYSGYKIAWLKKMLNGKVRNNTHLVFA